MENKRLLSLDILRGLTIILMIIVNDPGSWNHVYAPLLHAEWNGITPTDYVFPSFLFIVGVSVVLSMNKQLQNGKSRTDLVKKILWRALKIYAVGIFLWLWPSFNFEGIRWVGVLPRIAFVYLGCALLFLFTSRKTQAYLGISILLGYWLVMAYLPVPGIGFPDLDVPEKNWAHYIDQLFLPGRLWQDTWDPEGILSTLPALVSGLIGMWAGYLLMQKEDLKNRLNQLFFYGFVLLLLSDLMQWFFPFNKNLWSSSFTLFTGGIGMLALASFSYFFDVRQNRYQFKFAHAFGVNPILAYSLSSLLTIVFYSSKWWGISLSASFMSLWEQLGLPLKLGSLLYALCYVFIIWIPIQILFKKKIYIKL
ncbi:MAG: heparan-alpha-glucosaminide N-acetyltransferase domain-containing protein [Flavobacteriaceae bacterium]|nr:heparan-alpha-glucosaminide N-acetyltransferase domain-containing protein [Flavobacteriaceae bacterium]